MPDPAIVDPEVSLLARIASDLEGQYADDFAMWDGSPFQWIKTRPSRQVGAIGEKLVRYWCVARDLEVARSPDSEADLVIAGRRVEVKYSSLWTDHSIYKFQQIRDQNYDYCFCLGISPFDAHAWFIPKAELMINRPPSLVPQHGGRAGRDTKWLSFPADQPPSWLAPFGGTLSLVYQLISELGSGSSQLFRNPT